MNKDRKASVNEVNDFGEDCCSDSECCPPPQTIVRSLPKVGRNEPCPCDSGRKYKKCCGVAY